jgi:putative oxidoreductase
MGGLPPDCIPGLGERCVTAAIALHRDLVVTILDESRSLPPPTRVSAAQNQGGSTMDFVKPLSPYLLSILRIMTGLLFLAHGTGKWLGFPAGAMGYPQSFSNLLSGLPGSFFGSGMSGLFEIVGGILIVLGLLTRPVAFILSGVMAFAYFLVHHPRSFYPLLNQGDAAVLYCFIFLYLFAAGGGAWSLDRILGISKD